MSEPEEFRTTTEEGTLALGRKLAARLSDGGIIYLSGDLGVGKTTLVRGLLRGFGFEGRVKSPSYGLIESYDVDGLAVHHLDLYRLGHGEEIAYLGLEDLIDERTLLLIEWPERGEGWLPTADWLIHIDDHAGEGERLIRLEANARTD